MRTRRGAELLPFLSLKVSLNYKFLITNKAAVKREQCQIYFNTAKQKQVRGTNVPQLLLNNFQHLQQSSLSPNFNKVDTTLCINRNASNL